MIPTIFLQPSQPTTTLIENLGTCSISFFLCIVKNLEKICNVVSDWKHTKKINFKKIPAQPSWKNRVGGKSRWEWLNINLFFVTQPTVLFYVRAFTQVSISSVLHLRLQSSFPWKKDLLRLRMTFTYSTHNWEGVTAQKEELREMDLLRGSEWRDRKKKSCVKKKKEMRR